MTLNVAVARSVMRSSSRRWMVITVVAAAGLLTGCSLVSPPLPTVPPGATIDCGNLVDEVLCRTAVQVAITAQRNPPPITKATVHKLVSIDECGSVPPECIAGSVFVTLESGDTLQRILLGPDQVAAEGSNTD